MFETEQTNAKAHGVVIGTAAWTIPKLYSEHFPTEGTHLERYAKVFDGVEINSSFYRPHRPKTYEKWASMVPEHFRFSAKLPKVITHDRKLFDCKKELAVFASEIKCLGKNLGPILIQLPPSLELDTAGVEVFFDQVRMHFEQVVCEPRHASWFREDASKLLRRFEVDRVTADPPAGGVSELETWGESKVCYFRLHGSPAMYYSNYELPFMTHLNGAVTDAAGRGHKVWCIFDNTALGFATWNALQMDRLGIAAPPKLVDSTQRPLLARKPDDSIFV